MAVRIKDLDGITYDVDEDNACSYVISIGDENITIPFPEKINDTPVYAFLVVECNLSRIMEDDSNPNSRGGYSGTVTIRYYVDAQVPYFISDYEFLQQHPEMIGERATNYYEVSYLIRYVPMDNAYSLYFNDTMESIYELIDNAYEEEKEKEKQHNPEDCIHSIFGYGKVYCEHLTCNITEKDCYNCEKFMKKE